MKDDYTTHPMKVRITSEGDETYPWVIDGYDPATGDYTEAVCSYRTWAEAVAQIPTFIEATTREGIVWPWTVTQPTAPPRVRVRVDRYAVNDALTDLAVQNGVALDDATLNDLTHHVSDVLEAQEKWRSRSITLGRIIDTAQGLMPEAEADNPEYVRALVELITDACGLPHHIGRDLVRLALNLPMEGTS